MGSSLIGLSLVLAGVVAQLLESMVVKGYGQKHGKGGMFFNAVLCLFATVYFFASDMGGFQLPMGVFWYGLVNSFMYAVGFYMGYLALSSGSFGLTRLFTSLGMLLPIFYGILFLGEPITAFTAVGMVLVFAAVFLMMVHKRGLEKPTAVSARWIVSLVLMVLSNAAISIIGKMQNDTFAAYKNEYLIVSFVGAALWLTVLGLIYERQNLRTVIRYGALYGVAAGLFNGINNMLILVAHEYLPLSVSSPLRAVLGKLLSFLVALLIYRERFTRWQWAGVAMGTAAVVLMSI